METLLNLESVSSDQNLKGLRRLYNDIEANTRSLKALGVTPEAYGAMLSSVLLGKLPPDLRLLVGRKAADGELTLSRLQEILEEEIAVRERTVTPNQSQSRRMEKPPRSTTTTLLLDAKATPTCSYCQQSHFSSECSNVIGVSARREVLKTSGRCYNCLRRGHRAGQCRSQSRCQHCKRKHHSSICELKESRGRDTPVAPTRDLNPEAPPFEMTNNSMCVSGKKTVLLQTALTRVHNPSEPFTVVKLRALLDGGSQRSYITRRGQELLKLRPEGEQKLAIAAFGAAREEPKVCVIVTVGMELRDQTQLYLSLVVVPMICEPLVGQPISECLKGNDHLSKLELADIADCSSSLPIDILLGSDYYWEIVTGKVCRATSGPVGIHTKLGWVLSGAVSFDTASHESSHNTYSLGGF